MDPLAWLLLFIVALVFVCTAARRAYNREIESMTLKEREEERYQQQIW
jgi:hypothetical protein